MNDAPARTPTRLAAVLAERGVSQGELARRTGASRQTVFEAVHASRRIRFETWVRFARALGVPLAVLAPGHAAELDGLPLT